MPSPLRYAYAKLGHRYPRVVLAAQFQAGYVVVLGGVAMLTLYQHMSTGEFLQLVAAICVLITLENLLSLRLALQAVGRKLGLYLRRRLRVRQEGERRNMFLRYLGEIAEAVGQIEDYNTSQTKSLYDRLHEDSRAIFAALTPAMLAAKSTTPAGTPITTWKWLRAMLEHEAHHRGQLYLMLGMRGVARPPIYGLTSEEVRERSTIAAGGRATG